MTSVAIYEGECPECDGELREEERLNFEGNDDETSTYCDTCDEIVKIPFMEVIDA